MKTAIALLALAALCACAQSAAPNLRGTITRAQLDTVTTPLLLAEIPARGAQATLIPWGENAAVVSWRTADNASLAFEDGIVVATRGLGDDLMSADVTGTRRAIASGAGGQYPRHHSYIDGENQTFFRSFICETGTAQPVQINSFGQLRDVSRLDETCYSLEQTIDNTYWVGSDGTMWRSRQWLGGSLGYMTTERLVL